MSALPYIGRLGFYSDDWAFFGVLATAEDRSLGNLFSEQLDDPNLAMRPTQALNQAILFRLFGLEPLGYHLANLVVLIAVGVLLYRVLRLLGFPRALAVAVPAVYVLLPNYSTTRFWFASFGYTLGIALYLLGLYADLRAASSQGRKALWAWKALAVVGLTLAAFGYEVVLPLFLLNIVLAEVVARRRRGEGLRATVGRSGVALFHGSQLLIASAAVFYKTTVAVGVGFGESFPRHLLRLASGAAITDFGSHGVGLPHTVAWSARSAGLGAIAVALLIGITTYWYLTAARNDPEDRMLASVPWGPLGVVGLVIYALGYSVFLATERVGFSTTGIANRVATAAAVGFALVLVSALGWMATTLQRVPGARHLFGAGVALLCVAGAIVINGVASFWVQSWSLQRDVLDELRRAFPALPRESTLLLDGSCPYIGPAHVFASSWDLEGALRVAYRDPTVTADVTSGMTFVEPRGVVTRVYRIEAVHPYGERLFLYDRRTRSITILRNESVARTTLSDLARTRGCPEGGPLTGSVWLPFDRLRGWVHARLGW